MSTLKLKCDICNKTIKSAMKYDCEHMFCHSCDKPKKGKCQLCHYTNSLMSFAEEEEEVKFQNQFTNVYDQSDQKFAKNDEIILNKNPQNQTQKKIELLQTQINSTRKQLNLQSTSETPLVCKTHQQPYIFFHVNSNKLVCASCIFAHSNKKQYSSLMNTLQIYNNTSLLPLKNSLELMKKEIKNNFEEFNQYFNKLDDSLRLCRHSKNIIQTNYESILQEVTNTCEMMIKQIRTRETDLKNKITTYLKSKVLNYNDQEREFIKCKQYIKEIKMKGGNAYLFNSSNKNAKIVIEEVASMFQTSKELKKLLKGVKLDHQVFTLSELTLFKYDHKKFVEGLQGNLIFYEKAGQQQKTRYNTSNKKIKRNSSLSLSLSDYRNSTNHHQKQYTMKSTQEQKQYHTKNSFMSKEKQAKNVSYLSVLKHKREQNNRNKR